MRFVAVCGNGHLSDLDWKRWCHSESDSREQYQCQATTLSFVNRTDVGGGLRSLEVHCRTCRAKRSLHNLTARMSLRQIGLSCSGRQPWQSQSDAQDCGEFPVAMQRGASSVYFPNVVSAIDIPPESSWAHVNAPATNLMQHDEFRLLLKEQDHPLRDALLDLIASRTGILRPDVEEALASQLRAEAETSRPGSLNDIFPDEWEALRSPQGAHDPRDHFITRRAERTNTGVVTPAVQAAVDSVLSDVVLVDRLREVRVLKGFERHTMQSMVPSNLSPRPDELPAVEVFGEGFFLSFDEEAVREWESRPEVEERCARIVNRQQVHATWLDTPTPRYLLFHTLAHLLLRNTAFEAGYSTSALRERLYVTRPDEPPAMAGILVYTAAGDTEGTLGGLVRLGELPRLARLLAASVADAQWCSFDPVCNESTGQGPGGLSLAACHACTLVPETSCVAGNRLLDRRLVIDREFGFLRRLAREVGEVPTQGTW